MKKYLLALVALLVVATGCGNTKKLECSTEIQGLHQDVVAEYDGEDIKSIKMIMTYDAATLKSFGVTDSNRELFVSEMESEVCDAYNAHTGVKCVVTTPDGGMNITIDIDYPKIDQRAKDSLSLNYQSYDSLKSDLTKQGYTCK